MNQVFPAYIAVASASFLLGRWASTKLRSTDASESKVLQARSVPNVFTFVKILACATLVLLELAIANRTSGNWENVVLCITYAYATLLACVPLASRPFATSIHLNAILLVSFLIYVHRDVWPFATFTLVPEDLAHGWLLWAKILALAVAGIVVPLFSPRLYIPVDPENPMVEPNAEQTCPLFSILTYGFLDSLIFLAYKQGGLSFDQIPTLADYDSASWLIRKSFPALDPYSNGASNHLMYGFLRVYRREYMSLFALALCNVAFQFAGPTVMNRLLARRIDCPSLGLGRPAVFRSSCSCDKPGPIHIYRNA
ncbi:hypothetical protein FB451DRAFT_558591 [Mycena latifolia]|nr:hypothetical protein FB451DRAFT_558591 [Mycena latifolia]